MKLKDNAPPYLSTLEPDFEGTPRAIEAIQELSSTENWKQVFTYAGEAIIRKLDWQSRGLKIITHTARLFISTESGKIDGFNLDFSTSKISIDELKVMSKPQQPETSEAARNKT